MKILNVYKYVLAFNSLKKISIKKNILSVIILIEIVVSEAFQNIVEKLTIFN